ncbi:siderophore ABC transporter substrate-binding protein [Mesobaculum littorinae]|uniref:Siderophore ABC transporter substrate-binding protein n=1 Tax=Mesobaculum littorinae TaxID=2486419 RepID=A0A438AIR6_9RHOB|nr:siderophore ABC transporter substrate-binding protein [Mesobaculum littorinae]RVV98572.1 siderophore ABC transporter substrate-binding protein [Mesobaculum littorinae]
MTHRIRSGRLSLAVLPLALLSALPVAAQDTETEAPALADTAPVAAPDVTFDTARGEVSMPPAPETIAVFDIAAADTLDALGVEIAGTIDRVFVDYLAEMAEDAEVVGTIFEPDMEALNAMQPDLVVIGGRSAEQLDAVSGIAPTIDMTIPGEDMVDVAMDRIEAYGTLFERQAEAAALIGEFETRLAGVRETAADEGTALIVLTNGPKISAYGPGSRFGWIHDALDLAPAVEDVDTATHGEAISFEFIRDANPDWLIVIDRAAAIGQEGARAEETLNNELVAGTTAWEQGQVVYLNAADAYIAGGGIRSMTRTLDTLAQGFADAEQ